MIIRNQEHYLWYGIQHSKCYLQRHFETYPIISNVTTHCPKAHYKCLWKPKYLLIIKVHEGWKPMATCVVNVHFVGWTQPSPMGPAHMSKPVQRTSTRSRGLKMDNQPLFILDQRYRWRPLQENQVFGDELGVVPLAFYHPLLDVNSAQRLWYQLKSNGWWNSIIFLKTISPTEGGLKPSYPNLNKLML